MLIFAKGRDEWLPTVAASGLVDRELLCHDPNLLGMDVGLSAKI
jgi:hypothetical protein